MESTEAFRGSSLPLDLALLLVLSSWRADAQRRSSSKRPKSISGANKKFVRARGLGTSPPLTEVSRALRARNPKKVSKKSRGQSGKSPESLRKVSGECFWTVPGTFWRLFGVPGPEAPGDIFETFLGFRARRARETSVRGGLVPNKRPLNWNPEVLDQTRWSRTFACRICPE